MAMTAVAQERLAKDENLYKKRHSLAHIMAEAVSQVIPGAQIAFGPPVDNGFYYDFDLSRPLREEDLAAIEEKMREIIKSKAAFEQKIVSRDEALKLFQDQRYKSEAIRDLPAGEEISIFTSHGFLDLCRGPHVENMGQLDPTSFKLAKIAGAYWKGDERNPMLQRIYAYCFHNGAQLKEYLQFLEEAEKRDHRRLGRELDLYHTEDENPGQVFWHPAGWTIWRQIEDYVRDRIGKAGYREVKTPSVMPQSLWERSGHWAKYQAMMFVTESEKKLFALKPMNCPGHIEIFRQGIKSYRDLPLRLAEFGSCTRNEPSGALHGIMRVRGFVQDDAHIFCTENQISAEVADFVHLLKSVYKDFGFEDDKIIVKFSTRPEMRVGDDATWDRAEGALAQACQKAGLEYILAPGEGAFYGPKLEFTLVDALGRHWQCGTIQVDYQLPSAERLNAVYIGEDGAKHHPVMLHRAILGSLERFIGILVEHFSGAFPVWLNPVQVMLVPVSEKFNAYAQQVEATLKDHGFRCEADLTDQKMGAKIRSAQVRKIPYMLVVGEKEMTEGTVALRTRTGEQQNDMKLESFVFFLAGKVSKKELI